MIDIRTLTPKDRAAFDLFIKQQTGLEYTETLGLSSIRLSTLIDLFQSRKKGNGK